VRDGGRALTSADIPCREHTAPGNRTGKLLRLRGPNAGMGESCRAASERSRASVWRCAARLTARSRFHTQRKDTSEDGGSPRCPPRAGRANGSAGVRWAASDRRNYFFLHPGTADRESADHGGHVGNRRSESSWSLPRAPRPQHAPLREACPQSKLLRSRHISCSPICSRPTVHSSAVRRRAVTPPAAHTSR